MATYHIDHIEAKIIITKEFAREAGILNSSAYKMLKQLRADNPNYTVERRTISKTSKSRNRNLTYDNMRNYIIQREGERSKLEAEFDSVLALSKLQSGPYAFVKKWFLTKYKDDLSTIPQFETISA